MKHCWLVYNLKLTKKAFIYENGLDASLQVCTDVLEKQKPLKKKKCIGGEIGIQTLKFLKQSREGEKRRKWFLKYRSHKNKQLFCIPKNKYMSLLQKAKQDFFNKKKVFFKTVNLFLSSKGQSFERMKLNEKYNTQGKRKA